MKIFIAKTSESSIVYISLMTESTYQPEKVTGHDGDNDAFDVITVEFTYQKLSQSDHLGQKSGKSCQYNHNMEA